MVLAEVVSLLEELVLIRRNSVVRLAAVPASDPSRK
jgi:hypothetical protein